MFRMRKSAQTTITPDFPHQVTVWRANDEQENRKLIVHMKSKSRGRFCLNTFEKGEKQKPSLLFLSDIDTGHPPCTTIVVQVEIEVKTNCLFLFLIMSSLPSRWRQIGHTYA